MMFFSSSVDSPSANVGTTAKEIKIITRIPIMLM